MARPKKVGLEYFPLDCHMDDKIEMLEAEHGLEGFGVYIKLLQACYQLDDGKLDMSVVFRWKTLGKSYGIPAENLRKIVDTMLEIGLFDKKTFDEEQKLTSNGIQKRIQQVDQLRNKDRQRKTSAQPALSEGFPTENGGIPEIIGGKSTQKEKESKKEINKEGLSFTTDQTAKFKYWSILKISFSDYQSWLKTESKKVYVRFPDHWTSSMIDLYKTDWLSYRQAKRARLQPKSIQAQIDQLSSLNEVQLTACIRSSIANGYQGVFPANFIKQSATVHPSVHSTKTGKVFRELT